MDLQYKPDFERARTYWDTFWQHELIDRPCTIIRAATTDSPDALRCSYTGICSVDADFQEVVHEFNAYLETHAFLGEAMPAFTPGFGCDQIAGFLGAPIVMNPESHGTSWSEKIVEDWQTFLPLKIEEDNVYWQRMKELHAVADEHFRGRCLLSSIDMHSNIDALEGLRGAQKLLFDMIDTPETVHKAMQQVRELYPVIYNEFYTYGSKADLGTWGNLPFYSRGKFQRIQADFICLLSPDMFREFALDAIREEAQFLDHSCFHLDGPDALKHLDDILAIDEIDAVQWVPGAGNKPQIEWPEVLHRIQDAGKATIAGVTAEQVRAIHGEYKPELLVYVVSADTEQEGLALLDWLKKNT